MKFLNFEQKNNTMLTEITTTLYTIEDYLHLIEIVEDKPFSSTMKE